MPLFGTTKPTLKETIQAALAGWPQYCVTGSVLHCLVDDAPAFAWMTRREKNWLIAYANIAGLEPFEVSYDESLGPLSLGRRHRIRLDFGWFVHRASRYYYLFFYYLSYYLYMCSLSPED